MEQERYRYLAFVCYELQKSTKMVTMRGRTKKKTLKPKGASSLKSAKSE